MNFKQKTPRDVHFLKWIRTLACCRCGTTYNVQPHHSDSGGIALVGSDYSALPLCGGLDGCHCLLHQKYGKKGFWKEAELKELIAGLHQKYETETGRRILSTTTPDML